MHMMYHRARQRYIRNFSGPSCLFDTCDHAGLLQSGSNGVGPEERDGDQSESLTRREVITGSQLKVAPGPQNRAL